MDCQSHVYTHHALLIGIDSYQEKPLRGCVRDVQETRKLLDSMPKPAVVDTELLTASRNMDAKRCTSLEETPRLPTYHNVIESFKRITSQAKAGSFVYIHFSGHGTAFRPPLMSAPTSVFSNRSTGDLALNLLDSDGQTRYLHGSELVYLLEAMVSKKLIVTLVLDCCFSGSVMRTDANASASSSAAQSGNCIMEGIKGNAYNDTSIRFLDYDPNIVATHDTPSGSASHQNMHAEYRHASLRPNWLVNPNGYTVLTACGPTEIAREIQVDGNVHGALSYFLNEAFRKLGGIGGRQRHIYQYLRARFLETQKRYGHNQIPMLYGNKDLFFFGKANARTGSAPIPVTGNSRSGFFLEAGQAHGISRDDEFSICAFATLSRSSWGAVSTSSPVAARVRNVGVFISELDVPQTVAASNDVLMATPQTRLALRRLPILLDLSGAHADAWAEVVKEQRSLAVHGVNEKDYINSCCFAVSMSTDGFYEIRELSSQTLLRLPATPTAPKEDAMQLLETLRHLARYELTRRLTNNISGAQTNAFNHSFGVHIIDADGVRIKPGCLDSGILSTTCHHDKCLIRVEHNTTLQLEVENKGQHNLYLHIYTMSTTWQVENILAGDYVVVPPYAANKSDDFRKGSDGTWRKKLLMTIPEEVKLKGEKHCNDVMKIFLTTQPTSFLLLELPQLGGYLERQKLAESKGGYRGGPPEAWSALSFKIHTYLQA